MRASAGRKSPPTYLAIVEAANTMHAPLLSMSSRLTRTTNRSHAIKFILNLNLNLIGVLHTPRHPPDSSIPKQVVAAAGSIVEDRCRTSGPHVYLELFLRQDIVDIICSQQATENVVMTWKQHKLRHLKFACYPAGSWRLYGIAVKRVIREPARAADSHAKTYQT